MKTVLISKAFTFFALFLSVCAFYSCNEELNLNEDVSPIFTSNHRTVSKLNVVKVSASADDGNVPANTIDGNLSTRWSANGEGKYITFDLGSSQTVGSLKVAWYKGNQRTSDFKIRVGNSTSSMSTIYTGSSSGNTLNLEEYTFTPQNVRYVRLTCYGNSSNTWNSITEVEIYSDGTTEPEDPTPPTTPSGDYPSDVINSYFTQDLTNWKITVPYDNDGNGKADEIKQPDLDSFKHDEYFHVSSDGKGVVFKAHAGGTTTSGSGYPRSELREMKNNGKDNASWSSGSGTHTMEIRQAVTHLPEKKKHVVVGQIHDGGDDVIVFRLEDKKLFVDINGDDGPTLTSNYQLGTFFTVKFVVSNNQTKCYYNGSLKYTLNQSYSGAYFKAGCYTQSSCQGDKKVSGESCDAYAEVVITDLWVTHK